MCTFLLYMSNEHLFYKYFVCQSSYKRQKSFATYGCCHLRYIQELTCLLILSSLSRKHFCFSLKMSENEFKKMFKYYKQKEPSPSFDQVLDVYVCLGAVTICQIIITQPFPEMSQGCEREICRKLGFYLSSNFNNAFPSPCSSSKMRVPLIRMA